MKKIFTFLAILAVTMAAKAQVVLCDPQGNEYSDGQTMIILPEIEDDEGMIWVTFHSPILKNNGSDDVSVSLEIDVKTLPENTSVQACYPFECTMIYEPSVVKTLSATVPAGQTKVANVEWQNYDGETDSFAYGTCTIEFGVVVDDTKTSTVTVNYVYADPSGIQNVQNGTKKVVATYGINGQRLSANTHGIVIEKLSDGSVVKTIK